MSGCPPATDVTTHAPARSAAAELSQRWPEAHVSSEKAQYAPAAAATHAPRSAPRTQLPSLVQV
jgi:hypothetical protein